ncbi:MAG: insulinase family protein [Myxococcales bacterium]|nr:insulinase family protein [Myxococcales bacterium]
MQTVLVTDPAFPCAHLTLHFAAGPAFDPPERQGLTALTHRALIRGTRKRSREALEEAVEILGAELVTATRNHAVSLGGPVLTRHLDAYIDLVGETLCEPLLAEDEIEKVKRELLAEFEAACDEDGALARIWFQRVMYPGHPFGQGASGSKATLAAITPADVAAHAARVYTRHNLIVGASGDVTDDRLAARLGAALAPLQGGAPLDWSFPPVPQTRAAASPSSTAPAATRPRSSSATPPSPPPTPTSSRSTSRSPRSAAPSAAASCRSSASSAAGATAPMPASPPSAPAAPS